MKTLKIGLNGFGRIGRSFTRIALEKNLFEIVWKDIEQLKKQKLTHQEVFYFASFIHIVFVNIHPFEDGNGRIHRFLIHDILSRDNFLPVYIPSTRASGSFTSITFVAVSDFSASADI